MRGAAVFAGCGPAIAAPPVKTSGSVAPAIAQLQSCDARCVQTLHYCNTTFCRAKRFTTCRSPDFPLGGRDFLGAGIGQPPAPAPPNGTAPKRRVGLRISHWLLRVST